MNAWGSFFVVLSIESRERICYDSQIGKKWDKKETMRKLTMGILAHVDAGKTTLSESLLYLSGAIRKAGRVDNRDAFLDTFELERNRGITIFSKQAVFAFGDIQVSLLDTPGHVDFSAEMERTLQVLDYAILIISGADGVQGHTETLWKLLRQYQIPVFIFVNKMDQPDADREALLSECKRRLDSSCLDFTSDMESEEFLENLAMGDEAVLERYLETGEVSTEDIVSMIAQRKIYPCYFGSALKMTGVYGLMEGLVKYTANKSYPGAFGAKIYKIARDEQGNRLTYMKITGGSLSVKSLLSGGKKEDCWKEKVNQIRVYSGSHFEAVDEAQAGTVCAVTGLSHTHPGEGLGMESDSMMPILEPVLNYRVEILSDCDAHTMLQNLRMLEEEEPQMHVVWNEQLKEIRVQLMGEVQTEILTDTIYQRFKVPVRFGTGSIVYKETIQNTVEGVGHYEPLRHYAEVHLILEPGEPGSGLQFFTRCSEDVLDRNWQRLILTHLEEKEHLGVLTGSPITDMRIILSAGKAHLKHTEGGDFRQSTYRAVRQGLKMAESVLLEPYYEFRLEVPSEMIGRAMSDIQKMSGSFEPPLQEEEFAVLTGSAPVAEMQDYHREVISYTRGRGRLFCNLKGYEPCHNQEEVVAAIGYDSERDMDNPTGSVFCAHGAGFVVPWDQVREYMHLESTLETEVPKEPEAVMPVNEPGAYKRREREYRASEKELEAIFERTYGSIKQKRAGWAPRKKVSVPEAAIHSRRPHPKKKQYLLVDGYNIIFAWEDLKHLAEADISAARDKLTEILSDYQGYKKCSLILVFDAYKVEGGTGSVQKYHNIYVVYTKEAETADQYIEKTAHEIGHKYDVTVATSDGLEQVIIRGQGCKLLSAKELKEEVVLARRQVMEEIGEKRDKSKNYLFDHMDDEMAKYMEKVRLGEKEME